MLTLLCFLWGKERGVLFEDACKCFLVETFSGSDVAHGTKHVSRNQCFTTGTQGGVSRRGGVDA